MLVLKILATIFVAISFITAYTKNQTLFEGENKAILLTTLWGWLWRTFVIVVIWLIWQ